MIYKFWQKLLPSMRPSVHIVDVEPKQGIFNPEAPAIPGDVKAAAQPVANLFRWKKPSFGDEERHG